MSIIGGMDPSHALRRGRTLSEHVDHADWLSKLRSSCQALRDPLTHNNYERASKLVESIEGAARTLGFINLLHAATETREALNLWHRLLPKHQYAVNMYERAEWLYFEMEAATGSTDTSNNLQSYRQDFTLDRSGLYKINIREWNLSKIRLEVGDFRMPLRKMMFDLAEFSQELPALRGHDTLRSTTEFLRKAHRDCLRLSSTLKEAERRIGYCTHLQSSVAVL